MVSKYNRLRQGYKGINPLYKQYWLNIKTYIPYEDAYEYIEGQDIIDEITCLSYFFDMFKVVTYEQIDKYLKLRGFNIRNIDLDSLADYGFLNTFVISLEGAIEFRQNEIFYSIGVNMSIFMRKTLKLKVGRMLVSDVSLSPARLIHRFDLVDLYLNYVMSYGFNSIVEVKLKPSMIVTPVSWRSKDVIVPDADFIVNSDQGIKHLIILNVSSCNVNTLLPKTMDKLERLFKTDEVNVYFPNNAENVEIILLCENQEILEYAAKKMVVSFFVKKSMLKLLSVDYILRTKLSEYNIAYSIDQEGNLIEDKFI